MNKSLLRLFILHLALILSFHVVDSGITDGIATIGAFGISAGYWARCKFMECCNENYIPNDVLSMELALRRNVYGQHIAIDVVINAIAAHLNNPSAQKPLTMSFHGWTGSGKNYVTKFIMDSLYKNKDMSKYVHHFVARVHFTEKSKSMQYKRNLYEWIKSNVTECSQQLFIFDEVHLMPQGVLDAIKAIIDYNSSLDKVDYRKCIFIFLSNTGGSIITKQTVALWNNGIKREDISLRDFEGFIRQGAFNEEGGFFMSETISNNLIDHYIPFLPLEREHIELCIMSEFRLRGIASPKQKHIDHVLSFVEWGPAPENKFSTTGCKRLSQKVALLAQRLRAKEPSRNLEKCRKDRFIKPILII